MQADWAGEFQSGLFAGVEHGFDPARFAIYQNNVFASLIKVLRANFPAVERLLGESYFAALAKVYIVQDPPRSPILARWGAGFAPFLDAFAPLKPYPYLGDVARLDYARGQAAHAADAPSPPPEALADPSVVLALHPSAQIVISAYPLLDLWAGEPLGGAQSVLVFRQPDFRIAQEALAPEAVEFLKALPSAPLLSLCETAPFDPTALLCDLLRRGALTLG